MFLNCWLAPEDSFDYLIGVVFMNPPVLFYDTFLSNWS